MPGRPIPATVAHRHVPCPDLTHRRAERWPIAGTFTISRGAKTEAAVVVAELFRRPPSRARRMRALCPLWRDRRSVVAAIEALRPQIAARPRPRRPATGDAAGRRAQRARLRVLGPRGKARGPAGARACRPRRAAAARHRLYDLARSARRDGGGRGEGRRPRAAQGEARRRRAIRSASPPCGAPRRDAELIVDANEGLDAAEPDRQPRRLRRGRRDADRAAAAGRPDDVLVRLPASVPICADESVHARASLAGAGRTNTTRSTSSSTRPAASPKRWPPPRRRRGSGFR